jgi:hypothetical protein
MAEEGNDMIIIIVVLIAVGVVAYLVLGTTPAPTTTEKPIYKKLSDATSKDTSANDATASSNNFVVAVDSKSNGTAEHQIHWLARQNIHCPKGGMNGIQFHSDKKKMRIYMTSKCYDILIDEESIFEGADIDPENVYEGATETSGVAPDGAKDMHDLIGQTVDCGKDGFLQLFHMSGDPKSRIVYKCNQFLYDDELYEVKCRDMKTTTVTSELGKDAYNFPSMTCPKGSLLSGLKYTGTKFEYNCCKVVAKNAK